MNSLILNSGSLFTSSCGVVAGIFGYLRAVLYPVEEGTWYAILNLKCVVVGV